MKPSLSALIIAKDEERDLPGCLDSLKGLADEIVVLVDDSTTDDTERIAREAGCKVARRKFDNYADQRQAALEMCTKEWVLWIDCDERFNMFVVNSGGGDSPFTLLPEPGTTSIKSMAEVGILLSHNADAYDMGFEVKFLGNIMIFGGLGREHHVRLFQRAKAKFVGGLLHESLQIDGTIAVIRKRGFFSHEPYKSVSDYLSKLDKYTTLSAEKKYAAGQRFHFWHHLVAPWEFFSRTVLKLGILDGYPGIVWAGLSAFHSWLKYVKLRELELNIERREQKKKQEASRSTPYLWDIS